MYIIFIILLVIGIYLLMIAPNNGRQNRMKPFIENYIAHRGLFGNGIPENSLPAFKRAIDKGYGIELDVQTTSDGTLVVFHDETLERMCNVNRKLHECTYNELMQYKLAGTGDKIPSFDEVLELIDGKVPLIIEIKSEGNWRRTTRLVAERLDSYNPKDENGAYCVESFHPLALKWIRKKRPEILRGQLATNFFSSKVKTRLYEKILLSNLMLNYLSKPDFIAYNYRFRNKISLILCKYMFSAVTAAWTVKSEKVLEKVKGFFDVIIFDSFLPKK